MTYNSKKNITSMAAGIITITAYIVYALSERAPTQEDITTWAKLMLVFIGIGVAVQIVIQIIFHVTLSIRIATKEHEQDDKTVERIIASTVVEDERDKLINLKALRIGYICAGAGLLIALFTLAGGAPVVIALHIAVGSGAVASLVEGCAGILFHERGVRNG